MKDVQSETVLFESINSCQKMGKIIKWYLFTTHPNYVWGSLNLTYMAQPFCGKMPGTQVQINEA